MTGSTLFWVILIAIGGYVAILTLMYLFQANFVYFPTRNIVAGPDFHGLEYEDVYLQTEDDVRIHGWYVPAPDARGTLLFFHGNAGNISGRLESILLFHELGLNVLIIDYRGYGKSEGSASEEGTYRDAAAAWRYLTEVRECRPGSIVLFGRSLGGGVAAWLAAEVSAGAVVLESTYTSAVDLGSEHYPFFPVRWLMHIRYPVAEYLEDVDAPVMIAHSPADEIVPYHHGETLYQKAAEPKKWLEMQGGHNDGFIQTGDAYINAWDRFLAQYLDQ